MNYKQDNRYEKIIHLPHPSSKKHPHMPVEDRAAQFAPFAALTGHDTAIKETARLTECKLDLDEYEKNELDKRLNYIVSCGEDAPDITITYFLHDENKTGGKYVSVIGGIKKIDSYKKQIIMHDGTQIPVVDVISIEGECFDKEDSGL